MTQHFKSGYALLNYLVKNHGFAWQIIRGVKWHEVRHPMNKYMHVIRKRDLLIYCDSSSIVAYMDPIDPDAVIPDVYRNPNTSLYTFDFKYVKVLKTINRIRACKGLRRVICTGELI